MVEVNKESNEYIKNEIFIKTNEGKFSISLADDSNLYIGLYKLENNDKDEITFTITEENYFLYSSFNKLYEDIKNNKPSYINSHLQDDPDYLSYIKTRNPFNKNVVEWHSEDAEYDESSIMKISKENEGKITITFKKGTSKEYINNYFVCIKTLKSKYYPFNQNFIELYKKIDEYNNIKYHSIHMNEYLYNLQRTRK